MANGNNLPSLERAQFPNGDVPIDRLDEIRGLHRSILRGGLFKLKIAMGELRHSWHFAGHVVSNRDTLT